ncbi:MAG: acetylserotonin O-methyltransferase [Rhodobacteraceae bacterium]|nr:acetylserotonin O-methyltransferase [Paracoccaceae bacterium]
MTTPQHIMAVASGYGLSRALLSAVDLGLFSRLAAGPMTASEICAEYGLLARPGTDFLDLLVSAELLARQGDGEDARYLNTPETAAFLDRTQPEYIGGIIELWAKRNFGFWNTLTEAMQTGRAQNETKDGGTPFFETLYADPARLEAFMDAMTGSSIRNFRALAESFPFSRYHSLVDIGGADGLLAREVAVRHEGLSITTLDLPEVTEIAARKIAEAGLSDRITAQSGDFFAEPLPKADVITMGMILHDWNLERKQALVRKAYDALPEGGAFIVIEALIDDARRENTFGLFLSLNMLIEFGDAFDYTGAEFISWCREAGFRRFEILSLDGPSSAAIAYK